MKYEIKWIEKAVELSVTWDNTIIAYFQSREFLEYSEKYNPCNQRYYELYIDNEWRAGAVVYTAKVDLFTFTNIPSPIKVNFIGLPVSVSSPGLIGSQEDQYILVREILRLERGLIVGVNVDSSFQLSDINIMNYPPSVMLIHDFNTWDDYMAELRSDYRRRIGKYLKKFQNQDIKSHELNCSEMTEEMYQLYLDIHNKAKEKIEKLSYEYFKNLPSNIFRLKVYKYRQAILVWHIYVTDKDTLIYFFGGLNYELNDQFNSYFNNLAEILREAINKNYKQIDFGQTAEIAKLKLGGHLATKKMFGYHNSFVVRKTLGFASKIIEYKLNVPEFRVFKNNESTREISA
jgi:hypothetical protein